MVEVDLQAEERGVLAVNQYTVFAIVPEVAAQEASCPGASTPFEAGGAVAPAPAVLEPQVGTDHVPAHAIIVEGGAVAEPVFFRTIAQHDAIARRVECGDVFETAVTAVPRVTRDNQPIATGLPGAVDIQSLHQCTERGRRHGQYVSGETEGDGDLG
ncbi:hypothetical protein D3C80_1416470 [compost metagenome]